MSDKRTLLGCTTGGAQFGGFLLDVGPCDHKGIIGISLGVPAFAFGKGKETIGEVAGALGRGGKFYHEPGAGFDAAGIHALDKVLREHPQTAIRRESRDLEFRQVGAFL